MNLNELTFIIALSAEDTSAVYTPVPPAVIAAADHGILCVLMKLTSYHSLFTLYLKQKRESFGEGVLF